MTLMAKHIFIVLALVAAGCGTTDIGSDTTLGRHPSFATTTTVEHQTPTSSTQAVSATSTSSSVPLLRGPAPLVPSEQVKQVVLPDGVEAVISGLAGQIRATAVGPQGDFGWGLSYYTALWGSFPSVPPDGLLTASGTWPVSYTHLRAHET